MNYKTTKNILGALGIVLIIVLMLACVAALPMEGANFLFILPVYLFAIFLAPPCFAFSVVGLFSAMKAYRAEENRARLWIIFAVVEIVGFAAVFFMGLNVFLQATMGV